MSSSDVIAVVILARHGDREGFYQDPLTYTASATKITALGNVSLSNKLYVYSTHMFQCKPGARVPAWPAVPVDVHQCLVTDLCARHEHCTLRPDASASPGRWRRRTGCHLRLVYICGPRFMAGNFELQFVTCQWHDCRSSAWWLSIRSE